MTSLPSHAFPSQTGLGILDSHLPMLRMLAPQGFIFVSNLHLRGPEFFHSEYPREWQREYEGKNYPWTDPVLIWSMMWTGNKRWSEIKSPDPRGVREAASRFDLNYGAIFSRGGLKKTVLSLARADREFTDEEMTLIAGLLDRLVAEVASDQGLTIQELDTLRHLRDGLSHKEIASALGIAVSTVKLRLSTARGKLGANSNVHALALALQRNLL